MDTETDPNDALGLKLVSLGFVAVIAIAGLVLLFTQTDVTGQVSGLQRLGTQGIIERTPYEACRAVRDDINYVWNGYIDPRNNLIQCVDVRDPTNPNRVHWVELQLKYG
jgi:hypothetical protein